MRLPINPDHLFQYWTDFSGNSIRSYHAVRYNIIYQIYCFPTVPSGILRYPVVSCGNKTDHPDVGQTWRAFGVLPMVPLEILAMAPLVANGTIGLPLVPMIPLGGPMVPLALPLVPMVLPMVPLVEPMVPLVEPWTILVYHWYHW